VLLDMLRCIEAEPSLLGASGHLLTVTRRPGIHQRCTTKCGPDKDRQAWENDTSGLGRQNPDPGKLEIHK
jgi:hypothetical protein